MTTSNETRFKSMLQYSKRELESYELQPSRPFLEDRTRISLLQSTEHENGTGQGVPLEPKWKTSIFAGLSFLSTASWLALTIWASYAVSSSRSLSIFSRPETAIILISLLQSGSAFLLRQLVSLSFQQLRWTLASSASGIGADTFLALGSATGNLGVFDLLASVRSSQLLVWCSQRLLFTGIILLVSQLLLFKTHIVSGFVATTPAISIVAGYGTFNSTIGGSFTPTDVAFAFAINTYGVLSDPMQVVSFPPVTSACRSSDNCLSVFQAGGLGSVGPNPLDLLPQEFNGGSIYVTENAPGYQFEFYAGQVVFSQSDCHAYQAGNTALAVCLRNIESTLSVGWTVCPPDVVSNGGCLTQPAWITSPTLSTQISVSYLYSTTEYSLQNSSIVSVAPVSASIGTFIRASDIMSILDFAFDSSGPSTSSTSESLLTVISIINSSTTQASIRPLELTLLRSIVAFAILANTNIPLPGPSPTLGFFARNVSQLIISPLSRICFIVLSLSTLTWCSGVLIYCFFKSRPSPNLSHFPEMDFATKVITHEGSGMSDLLIDLGNATSQEVKKRVCGKNIYVGSLPSEGIERVVISTTSVSKKLMYGQQYL